MRESPPSPPPPSVIVGIPPPPIKKDELTQNGGIMPSLAYIPQKKFWEKNGENLISPQIPKKNFGRNCEKKGMVEFTFGILSLILE
jgi:hypothetical protein